MCVLTQQSLLSGEILLLVSRLVMLLTLYLFINKMLDQCWTENVNTWMLEASDKHYQLMQPDIGLLEE